MGKLASVRISFTFAASLTAMVNVSVAEAVTPSSPNVLFGMSEQPSINKINAWENVLGRIRREATSYTLCVLHPARCPNDKTREWSEMIKVHQRDNRQTKLSTVNDFFNQITYAPDQKNYDASDYWATLFEFLQKDAGDCEDYAIAKYITLRRLGFQARDLRIVVVKDTDTGIDHAILAYFPFDANAVILDNRRKEPVQENTITNYKIYYSFNENGNWKYKETALSEQASSLTQLSSPEP